MEKDFLFWVVTAFITGLVSLSWFFIKRYITSFSKKIALLFNKIDNLLDSFNIIDKILSVQEEKIETIRNDILELNKFKIKVSELELEVEKIKSFCKFNHNNK